MRKFYSPWPNSSSSTGENFDPHKRHGRAPLPDPEKPDSFRDQLCKLLNSNSKENGSNTPDFILARYMTDALVAFDRAVADRDKFYNSMKKTV